MQDLLNRCGRVLAVGICLIIHTAGLQAQPVADGVTIAGTVLDQSGKAIASASVAVKNEATGFVRSLTTDSDGRFTWQRRAWDVGLFDKRIGTLYNDNGSAIQAVRIDPFSVTNAFVNYTVKTASFLRGSKIGVAVNNLFVNYNIVAIAPGNGPTASVPYAPSGGDLLTLLPGRSVMFTLTVGYAPKR